MTHAAPSEAGQRAPDISRHFDGILRCTEASRKYARVLLASPLDARYPFVYPRDTSSAVRVLARLAVSPNRHSCANTAFDLVRTAAHFMKDVQAEDGSFGHRYTLEGEDASIYRHEVGTAHGLAILCHYLLTARSLDKNVAQLNEFLDALRRAIRYAHEHAFVRDVGLFSSTTSEHECGAETGFDLWTNCAFESAMRLATGVAIDVDSSHSIARQQAASSGPGMTRSAPTQSHENLADRFLHGGRYIARLNASGHADSRPDVTMLAPSYFGVPHDADALRATVRIVDETLSDPALGDMTRRHLVYNDAPEFHRHAGSGTSPAYSAILAQTLYELGEIDRAAALLAAIEDCNNENGELPEHVTTVRQFDEFFSSEWLTGRDAEKEFDRSIVRDDLSFDRVLAEVNRMAKSYEQSREHGTVPDRNSPDGGRVAFAFPSLRAHAETLRARLVAHGDWDTENGGRS